MKERKTGTTTLPYLAPISTEEQFEIYESDSFDPKAIPQIAIDELSDFLIKCMIEGGPDAQ